VPDDADVEPDPLGSDVDLPEILYHYTDINGLAGIWEKGQIWATNSLYLNDTSEVQLGLSMVGSRLAQRELEILQSINEVWKREVEQRKAGEEVDEETFNQERAAFEPKLTEAKEIRAAVETTDGYSNSYIACLTEHGDQLSQWRGYAREGYCVGFDTKSLLESLGDDRVMRRVRYYDEETNDAYAARMIGIAKGFRNLMIDKPDVDEDFRNFVIAKYMMVEAAFMKDSSFREESEVRIVEISGEPDVFTPHRYGMVPRMTILIPPGTVQSVRVGPSLDFARGLVGSEGAGTARLVGVDCGRWV
jgi:hypothetical protein